MNVSLVFATAQLITRKNAAATLRLRSSDPIIVDGETVEPSDKGVSDLDLTAEQSDALRALLADPAALAAAAETGSITLPDGGSRGKPLATGPTLASFVAANDPAEATAETPAKGKAK